MKAQRMKKAMVTYIANNSRSRKKEEQVRQPSVYRFTVV